MDNYIIVQHESAKIALEAAKDKTGVGKLQFGHGRVAEYTAIIESELCSMVYSLGLHDDLARWLNSWFDCLGPDEIDDFCSQFKKAHTLTKVEYNWRHIPTIATENSYCEIESPIFKSPVKLTLKQEMELLETIFIFNAEKPGQTILSRVESFFNKYCSKYGVSAQYKRDISNQAHELAWHFCLIHGISWRYVTCKRNPSISVKAKKSVKAGLLNTLAIVFFLLLWSGGVASLFIGGDWLMNNGWNWTGWICIAAGFLILSFSLRAVFYRQR